MVEHSGFDVPAFEHLFEDEPVGGVVVDHQCPHVSQHRRVAIRRRKLLLGYLAAWNLEVEVATGANRALYRDTAPHDVDQAAADRQAESGAAILAGRGTVGL